MSEIYELNAFRRRHRHTVQDKKTSFMINKREREMRIVRKFFFCIFALIYELYARITFADTFF